MRWGEWKGERVRGWEGENGRRSGEGGEWEVRGWGVEGWEGERMGNGMVGG